MHSFIRNCLTMQGWSQSTFPIYMFSYEDTILLGRNYILFIFRSSILETSLNCLLLRFNLVH